MKPSLTRLFACLLLIGCLTLTARAVTLQWSHLLGGPLLQLISDGVGGCAIVHQVGVNYVVSWYDSKGALRYVKAPISKPTVLMACDKNYLVFSYEEAGFYRVVIVDKKGRESVISTPGEHYVDFPGFGLNRTVQRRSDSKGFFVEHVFGADVELQRYSYK